MKIKQVFLVNRRYVFYFRSLIYIDISLYVDLLFCKKNSWFRSERRGYFRFLILVTPNTPKMELTASLFGAEYKESDYGKYHCKKKVQHIPSTMEL